MFEIKCPPVPHAIFAGCARTPNSACAVACEDGYVTSSALVLNSIVICMRGGVWSVPEDSVCEVPSCENSAGSCRGEGEICVDDTPSGFHCECRQSYVRNSGDTGCIVASCKNSAESCIGEGEICVDDTPSGFHCECRQSYVRNSGDTGCIGDLEDGVFVSSNMVTFPRTETKHAGKYTCVARLPGGTEIRATALLSIASPDVTTPATVFEPVFSRRPEDTELTLGHVAQFHCDVDIANAEVNWFKDDIQITVGGNSKGLLILLDNSLVIANTEIHHQGSYRCVVTSSDGRRAEATALAYFPTSYVFESVPSDGTVFDGEVYHLTCALRIATLTLSWLKDGAPLIYSERIFKLGGDVLLRDATANDTGQYVCVASDSEGHTVAQATAIVEVVTHNLNDFDCGIVTSSEVLDGANSRRLHSGRVVGGRDAVRGSAPWMARLYINRLGVRGHLCGGSLIDRQWVVTAAHCFDTKVELRAEHLFVRLGDHDTLIDDEAEISIRVEAFYVHENFVSETFNNDIALIKLATPLSRYSDYIRPICLANRTIDKRLTADRVSGRVNGWGSTTDGGAESVYLQEVYLPYNTFRKCKKKYRERGIIFTKNMFCAGYRRGGADACQGDSGGPYAVKEADRWYLIGIVSWGIGCGDAGSDGVYTRYSKYHQWLERIVNES
ncbi:putative low-density lipoprotein receptor-related protein 4 [Apostichopus japonicus]|uniref:Putative low-density lipoprotein receptor-related protein 4 n=1 Tax=Stichopus japonicus TaxID=307972 RepID=A0A2G8K2X0_STIJA|nr:putative low-density lipoprotein receptor-related protein 4 [Apostichopus japonicus]